MSKFGYNPNAPVWLPHGLVEEIERTIEEEMEEVLDELAKIEMELEMELEMEEVEEEDEKASDIEDFDKALAKFEGDLVRGGAVADKEVCHFDIKCTRSDCGRLHPKRDAEKGDTSAGCAAAKKVDPSKEVCHFDIKCTRWNCGRLHPNRDAAGTKPVWKASASDSKDWRKKP